MSTSTIVKKRGRPVANRQVDMDKILDISVKVFAGNGFDGAKLGDIAKQAGISNASISYHFESKDDLWRQSVTRLGEKLKSKFQEASLYFRDLEGLAELKAYTRQLVYFSAEHPEFYKIVFHEMCTKTDRAEWLVENIISPLHGLFDTKNSEVIDGELVFMGVPAANLSSIILGATNAFFMHAFQIEKMYNVDPMQPEQIELHANWVIDLIFAKFNQ